MKKKIRRRRASKLDRLTTAVMQTHAHEATADIVRRREVLTFEQAIIEEEVVALQARLTDARARRTRIEATLVGLGLTIAKR